jgi:hypothetical protein
MVGFHIKTIMHERKPPSEKDKNLIPVKGIGLI